MRALVIILAVLSFAAPAWGAYREGEYDCRGLLERLKDGAVEQIADRWHTVRSGAEKTLHRLKTLFQRQKPSSLNSVSQDYPKPGRSYTAHNKDTESPEGPGPKREAVASADRLGLRYWRQVAYANLNPDTGTVSLGRARNVPIASESAGGSFKTWHTSATNPPKAGDFALIPAGFEPVGIEAQTLVKMDSHGNVRFLKDGGGEFKIQSAQPRELSREDARMLTQVRHVPLSKLPEWMRNEVQRIKRSSLSPLEIAGRLSNFIQDQMLYRVDKSSELGVVEAAHSGKMQCDLAAVTYCTLLRDQFGITARIAVGYFGVEADGKSHVALPGSGHMWVEVFDPLAKTWVVIPWVVYDPTPTRKDRKTRDPQINDQFKQIQEEQGQEKPQEQAHIPPSENRDPKKGDPGGSYGESLDGENKGAGSALVLTSWQNAFEAYGSSSELAERLRAASEIARHTAEADSHALKSLTQEADRLLLALADKKNHYSSLRSLADGERGQMEVVRDSLGLLSRLRPLSREEKALLSALEGMTESFADPDPKRALKQRSAEVLSQLGDRGQEAFHEKALKDGTLSKADIENFALIAAVRELVDLHLEPEMGYPPTPKKRVVERHNPERPPTLRVMDDLGSLPYAYRDGLSSKHDLARFFRDELLERTNEEVRKTPPEPQPKREKSVIAISDQSPSMDEFGRYRIRDAAILALTDTLDLKDLYEINFGNAPQEPRRIGPDPELARPAFRARMNNEVPTINSTNIGAAVERAFALAETLESQDLNFVLFTDGDGAWSSSAFQARKARLEEKGTRIHFKVVFFGNGNPDLKAAAESTASEDGTASTITFSDERTQHILQLNAQQSAGQPNVLYRPSDGAKKALATATDELERARFVSAPVVLDPQLPPGKTISQPIALPPFPDSVALQDRPAFAKTFLEKVGQPLGMTTAEAQSKLSEPDREALRLWLRGGEK